MKTTLANGQVKYVIDDTDLDDELLPGKLHLLRLGVSLIVALLAAIGIVIGLVKAIGYLVR